MSRDLGATVVRALPCCDTTIVAATLTNDARINRIVIDGAFPLGGLQGFRHGGSTDGGRTFTEQAVRWPSLPAGSGLQRMQLHPGGFGVAVVSLPATDGDFSSWQVLGSRDGGLSWTAVTNPIPGSAGPHLPSQPFVDGRSVYYLTDFAPSPVRLANAALVDATGTITALRVPGEPRPPAAVRRHGDGPLLAGFGNTVAVRWYSSADEGRSWTALPGHAGGEDDLATLSGLWFFDAREGLLLGSDGVVMASDDGGRHWTSRGVFGGGFGPAHSLHFVPGGTGYAVSGFSLYRSDDRGRQWRRLDNLPPNVRQAQFVDADHGWVAAAECRSDGNVAFCDDHVWRTVDGGRQWKRLDIGAGDYRPMAFADRQVGVVVDASGNVWRTGDGGDSWSQARVDEAIGFSPNRVRFDARGRGWILPSTGAPRVLLSTDQGQTWRTVALPAPPADLNTTGLHDVRMADERRGWIVGAKGLVLGTDDGGRSWRAQRSGTERSLSLVYAIDAMTVWVGGGYPPTVLSSSTGGD